ncbi:MAG: YiiX/YebB-like N1pC/P60 family cysteine hydrolase [Proteobacteria bacterium]|nr:YiiX/YebB-like N1pC/P60 family cysteine hydrolase [Pseudomonadota bacterium]
MLKSKSFYPLLVILFLVSCTKEKDFKLKKGDLLFQDLDCGPVCDAIELATPGLDGARLSHVGVVSRVEKGNVYVIEAFVNGVEEVRFKDFILRSSDKKGKPKVLVGRVNLDEKLLDKAIEKARSVIGAKYDTGFNFDISDNKYFCSELVYDAFRDENNKPIFELKPMTFKEPGTNKTKEVWLQYFRDIKIKAPEGGMGISPGEISRSKYVNIVHAYGCPDGWSKCKY